MDAPNYANIIVKLSSEIDVLTRSFLFQGYQALANALKAPLGSLCILYIVVIGYGVARGLIKMPMQELVKGAFRIGLVYMLAMNWGIFSEYIVNFFTKGVGELGAVMMNLLPVQLPKLSQAAGINGGLQSVLIEVVRVGNWVWDTASLRHLGPYFTSLMVYVSGIVVIGLAFFELIVAKLMISICLCTAPLFIVLTLFDKTRTFFDQWLGKLVGFSLVIFFVSTVVGFCLHLLHWAVGAHFVSHAQSFVSVDWIPLVICSALGVMAILEVVGMAKSIGGSCCTSSGSAMVGGFVGGTLGAMAGGGATQMAGRGALKFGKAMMPGGAIASQAGAMASKAISSGASGMKAIQQRIRGQKQ